MRGGGGRHPRAAWCAPPSGRPVHCGLFPSPLPLWRAGGWGGAAGAAAWCLVAVACCRSPVTHLDQGDGDDGLGVNQRGDVQVVQATLLEDLGAGLEPHGLGGARLVQLGDDAAQGAEHGPAGVDHLQGPELLEGGGVGRQTGRVPAIVAGELASQVRGDIALAEGSCWIAGWWWRVCPIR